MQCTALLPVYKELCSYGLSWYACAMYQPKPEGELHLDGTVSINAFG